MESKSERASSEDGTETNCASPQPDDHVMTALNLTGDSAQGELYLWTQSGVSLLQALKANSKGRTYAQ